MSQITLFAKTCAAAAQMDAHALGRVRELRQPDLRDRAIIAPERPQRALLVAVQEPAAALIASSAPGRKAAERKREDRESADEKEQSCRADNERGKPGPPAIAERLPDIGQRSRHLPLGVWRRVEDRFTAPLPGRGVLGLNIADRRVPRREAHSLGLDLFGEGLDLAHGLSGAGVVSDTCGTSIA
jgi:hypothetical protein